MDLLTSGSAGAGAVQMGGIKLEGKVNWNTWKFQVTVLLKAMELYEVVNGTEVKTEDNKVDWAKKDAKAQGTIVTRICEREMVHILTCQSAAEMWKKLNLVYEQKTESRLYMLQQKFFQLTYSEDMSVFLSKVEEMRSQIRSSGDELSDKMIITKILMSLPEKYSHFISAWESVDPAKQTFDNLVARLLTEEGRLNSREEHEELALRAGTAKDWGRSNMKKY